MFGEQAKRKRIGKRAKKPPKKRREEQRLECADYQTRLL